MIIKRGVPVKVINVEYFLRVHVIVKAVLSPKVPNPRKGTHPGAGEGRAVFGMDDQVKKKIQFFFNW
jgi:hypothetical protein